jgi:ParB/RepB/Spo0J family partition protein
MKIQIKGEYKVVPLSDLRPNDWNPKTEIEDNEFNRKKFEHLKVSIKKHGFYDPIDVRVNDNGKTKYEILDGYHRYRAAKEEGIKEINIIDFGELSDALAKAHTIRSIKIRVPESEVMVAALVSELTQEEIKGFSEEELLALSSDEIGAYKEMSEFDWDDCFVKFEGSDQDAEHVEKQDKKKNIGTSHILKVVLDQASFTEIKKEFDDIGSEEFIKKLKLSFTKAK